MYRFYLKQICLVDQGMISEESPRNKADVDSNFCLNQTEKTVVFKNLTAFSRYLVSVFGSNDKGWSPATRIVINTTEAGSLSLCIIMCDYKHISVLSSCVTSCVIASIYLYHRALHLYNRALLPVYICIIVRYCQYISV